MNYQSQALQDRFVAKVLNFKRDGFFLDIGSCDAVSTNNTYVFEELGWKGICIEMDSQHNESYNKRTCKYIQADATRLDYEAILNNSPELIDYLSLDVDAFSTEVLKRLPLEEQKFGVITIEHDYYIHGGIYRDKQREILTKAGYVLYCPDVLVPLSHDTNPDCSFEDWWIHESLTGSVTLQGSMYPKDILEKIG